MNARFFDRKWREAQEVHFARKQGIVLSPEQYREAILSNSILKKDGMPVCRRQEAFRGVV